MNSRILLCGFLLFTSWVGSQFKNLLFIWNNTLDARRTIRYFS
jgi:hypothetical protein